MFLPAPHAITYTITETRARCHWYIHLSCPPRQARVKNGGAGDDRREGLPKINPGMAPTEHHSTLNTQRQRPISACLTITSDLRRPLVHLTQKVSFPWKFEGVGRRRSSTF